MLRKSKQPTVSYESLRQSWNKVHQPKLASMVRYFAKVDAGSESARMTDLDGLGFTLSFLDSEEVYVKFQLALHTEELVEQALHTLANEAHNSLYPEDAKKKEVKALFSLPGLAPIL
jgi:uncharacterized protein YacL (UPF0231 family)